MPQQLLYEGIASATNFHTPEKLPKLQLLWCIRNLTYTIFLHLTLSHKEALPIGFVQCQQLVDRELTLVQGTVEGALWALRTGEIAFNIAGGTHHAFSNRGEGFCMLNDQAIAAAYLLHHTAVKKVLIVDLDVHQGNGTAEIFRNTPEVFTFSMHAQANYPFEKEQSDKDIALPNGTDDKTYLDILRSVCHNS